jgi:hypothetical protein
MRSVVDLLVGKWRLLINGSAVGRELSSAIQGSIG